jgi:ribonuclease P protein component
MLNIKYRASKEDIEKTIKSGINIQGNLLYIKVSREKKEKKTFAVIISKKVEKTSVGRHFIKRRVSSAIDDFIKQKNSDFSRTVVIFPKKIDKNVEYLQIQKDVFDILSKIID